MKELYDFIATLPQDIQDEIAGNKSVGAIRKLEQLGIKIPDKILDSFDAEQERSFEHDHIMDGMRPFL